LRDRPGRPPVAGEWVARARTFDLGEMVVHPKRAGSGQLGLSSERRQVGVRVSAARGGQDHAEGD
jgi:hypothetical protein